MRGNRTVRFSSCSHGPPLVYSHSTCSSRAFRGPRRTFWPRSVACCAHCYPKCSADLAVVCSWRRVRRPRPRPLPLVLQLTGAAVGTAVIVVHVSSPAAVPLLSPLLPLPLLLPGGVSIRAELRPPPPPPPSQRLLLVGHQCQWWGVCQLPPPRPLFQRVQSCWFQLSPRRLRYQQHQLPLSLLAAPRHYR